MPLGYHAAVGMLDGKAADLEDQRTARASILFICSIETQSIATAVETRLRPHQISQDRKADQEAARARWFQFGGRRCHLRHGTGRNPDPDATRRSDSPSMGSMPPATKDLCCRHDDLWPSASTDKCCIEVGHESPFAAAASARSGKPLLCFRRSAFGATCRAHRLLTD